VSWCWNGWVVPKEEGLVWFGYRAERGAAAERAVVAPEGMVPCIGERIVPSPLGVGHDVGVDGCERVSGSERRVASRRRSEFGRE
jgi:hypothetical protein